MKDKSLRERYARALEATGFMRIPSRSERYWIYQRLRPGHSVRYVFLGRAGAVRGGRTLRTDLSFPLSPHVKEKLLDNLHPKQLTLF